MAEGHEQQAQVPDAFALSDDDFHAAVSDAESGTQDVAEPSEQEDTAPVGESSKETQAEPDNSGEAEAQEDTGKKQADDFKVDLGKPPKTYKITHRGQQVEVPEKQLISLAQQGFDYTEKTKALAPHRRLIDFIQKDPEAQKLLDQHFRRKAGMVEPEIKPYSGFDDDPDAWLKTNMQTIREQVKAELRQQTQQPQQPQQAALKTPNPADVVFTSLKARDKDNFEKVWPEVEKVMPNLTWQQVSHIRMDPLGAMSRLYDQVKARVGAAQTVDTPTTQANVIKPSFRSKSGGGQKVTQGKNAWEMSPKEFQAELARVKGY